MEKNIGDWWKEVKEDVSEYLQARGELTKIQLYEKIAKIVGVVISFMVLGFLIVFVVMFVLLMIGSWIAEATGSVAIGISSVGALLILSFLILMIKRKGILERPITDRVIDAMFDDEDEKRQFPK